MDRLSEQGLAGVLSQLTIEVTPEMVEAGVCEAREHPLGGSLQELVTKVFLAMLLERLD